MPLKTKRINTAVFVYCRAYDYDYVMMVWYVVCISFSVVGVLSAQLGAAQYNI